MDTYSLGAHCFPSHHLLLSKGYSFGDELSQTTINVAPLVCVGMLTSPCYCLPLPSLRTATILAVSPITIGCMSGPAVNWGCYHAMK